MGFFHEGHLELMKAAKNLSDSVVVSLFVNPKQFAPGEDFEQYPRDMERDLSLAEAQGVDTVFAPKIEALYPEGFQTFIELTQLPAHLCGLSRPTFFRGVATVVSKLFNIVKPHLAVFGEKDYQQLLVVRRMADDLNFDIEIVGVPIVREPDGLAMSSRNAYLTQRHRSSALSLYRSLMRASKMVRNGETRSDRIIRETDDFISSHPDAVIDYIAIFDPMTLAPITTIDRPVRMALAVKVGKTRLIDNMMLTPG